MKWRCACGHVNHWRTVCWKCTAEYPPKTEAEHEQNTKLEDPRRLPRRLLARGMAGRHGKTTDRHDAGDGMIAANTGGPAFPWNSEQEVPGMTLRDYFAAKAMHAFIGLGRETDVEEFYDIASDAYLLADAMLNARKA